MFAANFTLKSLAASQKIFFLSMPSMEDDLWWKMTFGGRQPLMEDDPR